MQKITEEQITKLTPLFAKRGHIKSLALYHELKEMQIGKMFFMSNEEWEKHRYKTSLSAVIANIHYGRVNINRFKCLTRRRFKVLKFKEGSVIKRVK